jgi:hypothetical protein
MQIIDRIRNSFVRNPAVWIFFFLFVLAEYWNYMKGRELARVCELLGPHEASVRHPRTAREEIDNICLRHEPDDSDDQ